MSRRTAIEWTTATWNPVVGCDKVSQGCKFCYAKLIHDQRHAAYLAGKKVAEQYRLPFESVQLMPDRLLMPVRWQSPEKIFVNSVSDLFHHSVPDAFIDRVMAVIALARHHTFQLLTKRPERMRDYFVEMTSGSHTMQDRWDDARQWLIGELAKPGPGSIGITPRRRLRFERDKEYIGVMMADTWHQPIPNLWAGVSVENQQAAAERIPLLLRTPGVAVRWISGEPLIGPVDLTSIEIERCEQGEHGCGQVVLANAFRASARCACCVEGPEPLVWYRLDWVVVGGESSTKRSQAVRPMSPEWARWLRRQCEDYEVPFLFKQWGDYAPTGHPSQPIARVGKKRAGRLLDGRTWDEYPQPGKVAR